MTKGENIGGAIRKIYEVFNKALLQGEQ